MYSDVVEVVVQLSASSVQYNTVQHSHVLESLPNQRNFLSLFFNQPPWWLAGFAYEDMSYIGWLYNLHAKSFFDL